MNAKTPVIGQTKGLSKLARAKFGPGMLLQHDDLEQLNLYTRELSRLMFRSFFGCGVVCGLVVDSKFECGKLYVTVAAGLALDCRGDPIHVPQKQRILVDENCDLKISGPLWVVLCGTEKCCAPRTSMCASDDDESTSVCTRERDGFEIRVVRDRPGSVCGCMEPENGQRAASLAKDANLLLDTECRCVNPELQCYIDHYDGKCGCNCVDCSDCDCDCILLACLSKDCDEGTKWTVDHSVRRFVRPVLMLDPQVKIEKDAQRAAEAQAKSQNPSPAEVTSQSPAQTKASEPPELSSETNAS